MQRNCVHANVSSRGSRNKLTFVSLDVQVSVDQRIGTEFHSKQFSNKVNCRNVCRREGWNILVCRIKARLRTRSV
jgi:hypothetical protein